MQNRHRVFIFPCGSEVGLEINRAIAFSTHFEAIGGTSVDDHGAFAYTKCISGLPLISEPHLYERLTQVFTAENIVLLLPAHDSAVLTFAEWSHQGALGSVRYVGSPFATCQIARSKAATYRYLNQVVNTPTLYDAMSASLPFPLFLKPDVGQGSRGTYIARDQDELALYMRRDPTLLACEYLPGQEYTVDCFTDRFGVLRYVGGRHRRRVSNGISVGSLASDDPRLTDMAAAINSKVHFRGQWFFQAKERASGELVLLEIAPRAAGSSGFARAMGANLPLLSLHDALDRNIAITPNRYHLCTDRALATRARIDLQFSHVYVDFDDTLIWDGQVNHRLLAVLYHFRATGKQLHLISRHQSRFGKPVRDAMTDHAISDRIFSRVIDVSAESRKSDYIDDVDSIFIDDSFAERSDVSTTIGIATFDVSHAIDVFGTLL